MNQMPSRTGGTLSLCDQSWLLARFGRALEIGEEAARQSMLSRLPLELLLQILAADRELRLPTLVAGAYRDWINANPTSPQLAAAWFNLAVERGRAGDDAGAAEAYGWALATKPDFHPAAVNLGLLLEARGNPETALLRWQAALQPDEARAALLNQRGRLLESLGRYAEAERALHASLLTIPDQPDVVQHWSHLRQKGCIWPVLPPEGIPGLTAEELALRVGPLSALALTGDATLQRRISEHWLNRKVPPAPARLSPLEGYRHDRIRLGYLSSDFCSHAMSYLIVGLLEQHDRRDFEVFGYCSSFEDGSPIRQRVLRALDQHVPVREMDDAALARRIRADEIDIVVDLNGITGGARLHALRWKPAPVQATYLGYIGSVPLPELDYLLCDAHVIPAEAAPLYAPRPLPLPRIYQPNDGRVPVLPPVSRATEGLPKDGFVFCSFCNSYKITPEIFDAWTAILHRVPGSVLWLVGENDTAQRNLLARAASHGIGEDRLVFARRVEPSRYLARIALADLFLDTSPYNAGTVASDALRMGLPLLTLSQQAFSSRMAASLLRSVGMVETMVHDLQAYVTEAVDIGQDPARHARLRSMLSGGAWQRALGDSARFARELEDVFRGIRLHPDHPPRSRYTCAGAGAVA